VRLVSQPRLFPYVTGNNGRKEENPHSAQHSDILDSFIPTPPKTGRERGIPVRELMSETVRISVKTVIYSCPECRI